MAKFTNYNPYSVHPVINLGLGMNTQMDSSQILDNEIADCENFSIESGTLATAPGYAQWDDAPEDHYGPYWGGIMFKKSTGEMVDVRQRQDILEYSPYGDPTWYPCTLPTAGSPAATISLAQCQPTFAVLNDICVFTNGVDEVMSSTDGITWTLQPSLPKCKVVFENAKNRLLYLAQVGTEHQYRFDWSNINDPLTISEASFQLIDPNNYGDIVGAGLTPDGTTLVFKEGAVYSVADFVDDGIIDINFIGQTTCFNHHTICTTNDSVIWTGYASVYEYIGGTIRNIFGRINPNGRNDCLRNDLYCAAFYNNRYHLAMPDAEISQDYNAQEYVFYKKILRDDPIQPYAITRNRRYIGTYFIEDAVFDYGRDISLYLGDSRSDGNMFAFLNDYRDPSYVSGLNGEVQTCFFVTKYFTENMSYYTKKYKKLFANMKLFQTTTIKLSYRFVPYGSWTDTTAEVLVELVNFLEGYGFEEGYGFSQETFGAIFIDINNPEKPRGIQFKFEVSTTKDISYLSLAHSFIIKPKFK